MSKIGTVFKKEMLCFFRDKKTLITIFLPILIYPIIMIFLIGIMNFVESKNEDKVFVFYINHQIEEGLFVALDNSEFIVAKRVDLSDSEINKSDFSEMNGYLSLDEIDGNQTYILSYHSNFTDSQRTNAEVLKIFNAFNESKLDEQLISFNILDEYNNVVTISSEDIMGEGSSRITSMILGMILPFIIVLYGIVGTNIISSDLTAGEKERASLETIFSAPISRVEIIFGKLLACSSVGLMSGGINILSLFPLIMVITNSFEDVQINLSFGLLFFLILQLIPIMIMCSALFIGIGMFARTYQESQSYASVALIAIMGLTYIFLIPGLEGGLLLYSLPITNAMLLMREAFLGSYPWMAILQVLIINMGMATLAMLFMNLVFNNDRMIFGGDSR